MNLITSQELLAEGACPHQVATFSKRWPVGAEVTKANCLTAVALQLDITWFAHYFLRAPALKIYKEGVETAWKTYQESREEILRDEREADQKAYLEARAPDWKVFQEAWETALKIYKEGVATALWTALKNQKVKKR